MLCHVVNDLGYVCSLSQCIALEYARRGAKLVLAARRQEELKEVAKKCGASGAQDAAICVTDVSEPEDCKNLVQFAVETIGRSKSRRLLNAQPAGSVRASLVQFQ